jgi:hypothetical protein
VRPSRFVPAAGTTARDALTVAANRIHNNGDRRVDVSYAEVAFDSAPFPGAPAPTTPLTWVFGSDGHTCGDGGTRNLIYRVTKFHPLVEVAHGSVALLRRVVWDVVPAEIRVVASGTGDVGNPCPEAPPFP